MAGEYGWAKKDILEQVYFDELPIYIKLINRRTINNYKMLLSIAISPHTKKPNDLMDQFIKMEQKNEGLDYLNSEFDAVGFERLKQKMSSVGGSIIVK